MPFFQVQLKKGTKTITENVEANDYKDVLEYYYKLSTCEVIEIREWLEKKNTIKKDDGDYVSYITCTISSQDSVPQKIKIPKVRSNIDDNELDNFIKNSLLINGKKPLFIRKVYNF